ncbi:hypothetical protein NECID01_0279 [Nematocida sp. AWRm77]|nr:hypothetical protein NECID01_0279 [Nematocida sp. AWRm77]
MEKEQKNEETLGAESGNTPKKAHPNIEEVIDRLGLQASHLEKRIVEEGEVSEEAVLSTVAEAEKTVKTLAGIESVSEYVIVEKHSAMSCIVRILILCKIANRSQKVSSAVSQIESTHRIDMLTRNLKVCHGEMDKTRGVLVESLFLNITINNSALLRKIEAFRALKAKISMKSRLQKKETPMDRYLKAAVATFIDDIIKTMVPISKDTPYEKMYEILEGILETENAQFITQIIYSDGGYSAGPVYNNPLLSVKNVLSALTLIDSGSSPQEKEKHYVMHLLILKLVSRNIISRKAGVPEKRIPGVAGKEVLEEIFDEEEIEIMLKLVKKEKDVPQAIQAEILSILIEGDVQLVKPESIPITRHNITFLMRYVVRYPEDTEALLLGLISAIEVDSMEEEDDAQTEGEYSPVFVLDFFNEVLKTYVQKSTPTNISFQKYIAGSVLEVYGGIIPNTANPFIVSGYLSLLSLLLGVQKLPSAHADGHDLEKEKEKDAPYFSTHLNRNLVLSRCVGTIGTAMRQTSTFLMQGASLYVDTPTIALGRAFERGPRRRHSMEMDAWCAGERKASPSTDEEGSPAFLPLITQSILFLFCIAIYLPDTAKVGLASGQLMNILFRELSRHESVTKETLCFIRGFFASKAVVQKVSSSVSNSFFLLLIALVSKGELDTVQEILTNNRRLYKGFFSYSIVSVETVRLYREDPALYSLISTLMVFYYLDDLKLNNEPINRSIADLFEGVLSNLRAYPHTVGLLADTREFGYFFKAAVVLGRPLSFNTEGLLYLLLKTQSTAADTSVRACSTSMLYKYKSRTVAECFFFYHFVQLGVSKVVSGDEEDLGKLCYSELTSPYSNTMLKYVALLGLDAKDVSKSPECAKLFRTIDFPELSEEERQLFVNQIYKALFLTGCIQEGGPGLSLPFTVQSSGEEKKAYQYADMCIRSAIKATETTCTPCTLPISVLSGGSPHLVAALLYTLYQSTPNSAVILSYIKKMRKFVREDTSVFSRVLATIEG